MSNDTESSKVALPRCLDIAHAEEMAQQLRQTADAGTDVAIDASAVEVVDSAGAQLLTAFVLACEGREVSWAERSDALDGAARLLGLEAALRLDEGAPSNAA